MRPVIYKIRVKRRFFFGWTEYEAVFHATEILGATARLVIEFFDGTKVAIPRIEKRTVFVYPPR